MVDDLKLKVRTSGEFADPLLFIIMDGVGLYRGRGEGYAGNAFEQAKTPNLDRLFKEAPVFLELKAHGKAVGLPTDDDMGNSEVGHNTLGGGRVFEQGAKLVNTAIGSGALFTTQVWRDLVDQVKAGGGIFHLLGLVSDGNVHSHIKHLLALIERLEAEGVARVRVHALADGRDVEPMSYHRYIAQLETLLSRISRNQEMDFAVASGGGRMRMTMDRYNADWQMVQRGWAAHVLGRGRGFRSCSDAIEVLRAETPGIIDQDLDPFVIVDSNGAPIGPIGDGDSVVLFNFRGDRAIEISRALTEKNLTEFDRERIPKIAFAGMMEYDGDLHIPPRFLVHPPAIDKTVSEYLVRNGVSQLAVAETQKFGHVTYFWNGNNSKQFDPELEDWVEVPSDIVPFDQKPEMKAREVCQVVENALDQGAYRFIRVNFANGDMVGHTGSLDASIEAMEVVDECIGRLERAVNRVGGMMVVTADHGNLDMMYEVEKTTSKVKMDANGVPVKKTSHTLSPVPWVLLGHGAESYRANHRLNQPGLGNIAATLLLLLGFEAPEDYLPALVRIQKDI
ncbi:MAG: 2,3-bisphosphoglycerate-independent phosphoglycerate mutase [Acidobacteria bacterium]|nr:2,3-bisphosphoglycerate-independent phosphoglycerate mutase [Acidobacteriota bacterium]